MGFDKNRRSEEKSETHEKPESVPTDDKSITDTASETASTTYRSIYPVTSTEEDS